MVRWLTILALFLTPISVSAEVDAEVAAVAAGELNVAPEFGGNGILLVQADLGRYRIRLNTDTLDLSGSFEASDETTVRLGLAGEAFAAGVLTSYYRAGELVRSRAFSASWGGGYVAIERRLRDRLFLGWRPAIRRWRFGHGTNESLELPPGFTSVESKFSLTFWDFAPDRSLWQPHRLFRRLDGIGAGVEALYWWRSAAERWGAREDPRNPAEPHNVAVTQWASFGAGSEGARAQLQQRLRIGHGEDDINRARVGGFNPYSVPLAGVGWPAWLTSRYLSGRGSLHFRVIGETEVGLAVDGVMLQDPLRQGDDGFGAFGGVSAFIDARVDRWQFDAHVGYALPSPLIARGPQLGAFFALGRSM